MEFSNLDYNPSFLGAFKKAHLKAIRKLMEKLP